MADSDDTTTLPSVTRARKISATDLDDREESADPTLTASLAWIEAHTTTIGHCLNQQRIETALRRGGRDNKGMRRAYLEALAAEEDAAAKEQALLERLARTPANSLAGVAAKLSVIVWETGDNTDLSDFPVEHVRSALDDIQRLMDQATFEQLLVLVPGISTDGCLEPSSLAAWYALRAWSLDDEKRYRIWMDAFKALMDL